MAIPRWRAALLAVAACARAASAPAGHEPGSGGDAPELRLPRDVRPVRYALELTVARRAFPCFDDPGFKTPFDVALVVPAADLAVGNAPAVEERPEGAGQKRVRFARTPPLPTYLVFVGVGPFETAAEA